MTCEGSSPQVAAQTSSPIVPTWGRSFILFWKVWGPYLAPILVVPRILAFCASSLCPFQVEPSGRMQNEGPLLVNNPFSSRCGIACAGVLVSPSAWEFFVVEKARDESCRTTAPPLSFFCSFCSPLTVRCLSTPAFSSKFPSLC